MRRAYPTISDTHKLYERKDESNEALGYPLTKSKQAAIHSKRVKNRKRVRFSLGSARLQWIEKN